MVHKRFAAGLLRHWLHGLLRITAMTGLGLLIGEPVFNAIASDNRFDILLGLAVSGLICLALVTFTTRPVVTRLYLLMTDRKSTRLNSSHVKISYAVFCLKKKKT